MGQGSGFGIFTKKTNLIIFHGIPFENCCELACFLKRGHVMVYSFIKQGVRDEKVGIYWTFGPFFFGFGRS